MKLSTARLRLFKQNSSFIKQNKILPILGYLKFDKGSVTKTNLQSFLNQEMLGSEPMLVDEKLLMNVLGGTTSEEITITQKGDRVYITDGVTNVSCATDKFSNFPSIPDTDGDSFPLEKDVLDSIRIASTFIIELPEPDRRCFVFVGKKFVCGSDGVVVYAKEFQDDLPEMALPKETAMAINKFNSLSFSETESYHFFSSETCKYGFIKPAYYFQDLTPLSKFDTKSPYFEVSKSVIINFNEICLSSSPIKKIAEFSAEGKSLSLSFIDSDYEINIDREVEAAVVGVHQKFNYNAAEMNKMLKMLPNEELFFHKGVNKYYITGLDGFVCLIIEIA